MKEKEHRGSDVCPWPSGAASRWDQWGRLRDRVEVGCHDEGWGGIEQEEAHPSPPDSRPFLVLQEVVLANRHVTHALLVHGTFDAPHLDRVDLEVLERLVLCYEQPRLADHMVIGALSISSPRSATSPLTTAGRGREGRGRVRLGHRQ